MCKVVKIRIKALLLSAMALVMVILINSIAHASSLNGQKLQISNVDVKVSSKTLLNLTDGQTVSEEARSDHVVEFRVEVRNNFTRSQDFKIRDITVKTTIEGIDNGEDLEIESDRFDLRADTERKSFFKFDIPLQVREDSYNVIITAEGQDEDGTSETAEMKLKLEVVNDNHMLKIIKASLTPAQVTCNRKNVQLAAAILNTGNLDEDGVSVQISNSDLGLDIRDKVGTIFSRPNEPESRFSKTYVFNVPKDLEAGNYPITLKVLYNDDRKSAENTATLIVNNCAKASNLEPAKPAEGSGVDVITPPDAGKTYGQNQLPPGTVITQESFLSSNAFLVGIIVLAVVILGIVIVLGLFGRRG